MVDVVRATARRRGISLAQVALAWLASRPGITAPLIGATKTSHIDEAVASLETHPRSSRDRLPRGSLPPPPGPGPRLIRTNCLESTISPSNRRPAREGAQLGAAPMSRSTGDRPLRRLPLIEQ
ncbi:MAG: aldo/keto reductase [Nocardioidaceae bacterium]